MELTQYQIENRDEARKIQATGPLYAAEFARLTGLAWSYVDLARPDEDRSDVWSRRGYNLREEGTGLLVSIYVSKHDKKAHASPVMPPRPDGTFSARPSIWRDYGIEVDGTRSQDAPVAAVAYDRFFSAVPACAKRFVDHVYRPFAAVWSQVEARLASDVESYAARDKVAADLAAEFGGEVRTPRNGGSALSVRIPDGPHIEVTAGGYVRLDHASFNLRTLRAYLWAHRKDAMTPAGRVRAAAEKVRAAAKWSTFSADVTGNGSLEMDRALRNLAAVLAETKES